MQRWVMLCLIALTTLLAGCNQPAVAPKSLAFQDSENTVRDWKDVAHRIRSAMAWRGLVPSYYHRESPPRPVFVRVQPTDSTFLREVADELEADILRRGGSLAHEPSGATVVVLDVDVVAWSGNNKPPGLRFTTLEAPAVPAMAIGLAAPLSAASAITAAGLTLGGLGLLADQVIALTPDTNTEAVWKATIEVDNQTVIKIVEPVYIRPDDARLYWKPAALETRLLPYAP